MGTIKLYEDEFRNKEQYKQEFWNIFHNAFQDGYKEYLEFLMRWLENTDPLISKNKFEQDLADWQEELRQSIPDLEERFNSEKLKQDYSSFPFPQDIVLAEDYANIFLSYMMTSRWIDSGEYFYFGKVMSRRLITAAAIQLFEMDHGRIPEQLSELTPDYIPQVLSDPFNYFRELKYVTDGQGYSVYSTGPDREDQLGRTLLDWDMYRRDKAQARGDVVFKK